MKGLIVLWLALVVAGIAGWVMNIIQITNLSEYNGLFFVKCIGILIAPLGAVLGWIG